MRSEAGSSRSEFSSEDEGSSEVDSRLEEEGRTQNQRVVSSHSPSPSLFSVSAAVLSALALMEEVSAVTGSAASPTSNTTSTPLNVTTTPPSVNHGNTAMTVASAVLWSVVLLFFIFVVAGFLILREYRTRAELGDNQQQGDVVDQPVDVLGGVIALEGAPNGSALVGGRDPDDPQGEIMELREPAWGWGWGHIPMRVFPMIRMGGPQIGEGEGDEEGEEEAEDAV